MNSRIFAKGQAIIKKFLLDFLNRVRANANGVFNRYVTILTEWKLPGQITLWSENAIDFA